jgi:hypothetical protein
MIGSSASSSDSPTLCCVNASERRLTPYLQRVVVISNWYQSRMADKHQFVLRIPTEWMPEIEQAANRRLSSKHNFILRALRAALDGEPK